MEAMESNNHASVAEWFTENSTIWIPPAEPITGLSRIKALFRALFNRYHEVHWTIVDIIPVNDNRCIHICDSWGDMKTKPDYKNRVMTDITFDTDGKILYLSDYFKDTSVFTSSTT